MAETVKPRRASRGSDHLLRQAQFALDLGWLAFAFIFAYLLRFDFKLPSEVRWQLALQLPYVVLIQFATLFLTGVYSFVWRFIGLRELNAFVRAATYSAIPVLGLRLFLPDPYRDWKVPLSIIVMSSLIGFGGLLALRVARRMIYEQERRRRSQSDGSDRRKPVLFIGAGRAGITAAREVQSRGDAQIEVRGFVDDDESKVGTVIQGVRVLGRTRDLPELVRRHRIDHVVLTIVEASRNEIRRILDICEAAQVRARVIPGLWELLEGSVQISRIRDVQIEDLLGREPVRLEPGSLETFLANKRVLITGAGGSIGSELARQVLRFSPERLLLLDRSEYALFDLDRWLESRDPEGRRRPLLIDVGDPDDVRRVFAAERPQVVLHAAAHKHVPMLEYHPSEAVRNNVLATHLLCETARAEAVEAFVLVSTDKAVRPTSIMGASKRASELVLQDVAARSEATRFVAVRFGNVLGSTGSVVPIFREQIRQGGPVRVTHPSVTRYFMTPSEASQLVLQAGAIGSTGEIMILDMGEPVRIVDLAEDMIRLSGLRPYEDVDIVYDGLRPGEKLYEELELTGENISETRHPKIYAGKLERYACERIDFALRRLGELAGRGEQDAIRAFLAELIPESTLARTQPDPAPLRDAGDRR